MKKQQYYKRIIVPPKDKSFFLFGPRGTGKTSWLKKNFKKALYFDLLDHAIYRKLLARPNLLEKMIPKNFSDWIILDEIQRIPDLLNEVHRLIENKKYKFILTGSSARKLRKKGINLLAGRALKYSLYPLSIIELGDDFFLEKSLQVGHLPAAYLNNDANKFLESYLETYLKEEVAEEGLTRNLGNFYRFLEVASFSQGEVLNISEIARETEIKRNVVENYFSILEDLLITYKIPVFSRRSKRRLIKHHKFYFFDIGVFRTLRPKGPLDSEVEIDGASLETLFLQELISINDYYQLGYKIYYWQTSNGMEVDFVLYGNRGLLAFEIKRKNNLQKKDFNGLKSFSKDFPEAQAFMVSFSEQKEYHHNIQVVPFENTIKKLKQILLNR